MTEHRDLSVVMEDLSEQLSLLHSGQRPRPEREEAAEVEELQSALEELKAAQDELMTARTDAEAQRTRYHDLFQFAPDGYLVTDLYGRISEANQAACALLNRRPNFILDKPFPIYVDTEDRARLRVELCRLRKKDRLELRVRLLPRGKAPVDTQVTAGAVRNWLGEVSAVRWIIRDVTKRKRAEEDLLKNRRGLQLMTSKIALVEEQERRRIANDIHDHIGQSLALAKLRLGLLREKIGGEQQAELDEIRNLLSKTIGQVRSLTFELSPTVLYELGLGAAIEWLIEQRAACGVAFSFHNQAPDQSLRPEVQITLFQTIRELLANVIKHAAARSCAVSLLQRDEEVVVEVEDDGAGFDPVATLARRPRDNSLGLFSVQERLAHLKGRVHIDSAPGHGTRVQLVVPLRPRKKVRKREVRHATERADRG